MWWCVDLVRAYTRGWRDKIVKLTTEASRHDLMDMKTMLPVVFDDVGQWHHELFHDPQRKPALLTEIHRRAKLTPPEHREAFTAAVAEADVSGVDPADVTLAVADQVHMSASNMAAAGIAYMGIAQFEQHLNQKERGVARLLGNPRSYAFPPPGT